MAATPVPNPLDAEKWMPGSEVAAELRRRGVRSHATKRKWTVLGILPEPVRLFTGRLLYPRQATLAALAYLDSPEHLAAVEKQYQEAGRRAGRASSEKRRRREGVGA